MKISKSKLEQIIQEELQSLLDEGDDRCTRIAKRKYDVWPSAYASGAVVKCRDGKIWKDLKEEDKDTYGDEVVKRNKKDREESADELGLEEKKTDYSKEKESGLHGWFSRQGGKGKSKGWVDCNTCRTDKKTGKKTCKSCGRKEGEKRSEYPACRPTPSDCGTKGKGKKWGKKSAKKESLDMKIGSSQLKEIIKEELESLLDEELEREYYEMLAEGETLEEAEYQGRKVTLNKPMQGDVKKSKVYVKNEKGNVVKVNFGDPDMKIRKSNPKARKSFRARHNCDNPGPKWKARYWSCKAW